jgi:hypothetical protein
MNSFKNDRKCFFMLTIGLKLLRVNAMRIRRFFSRGGQNFSRIGPGYGANNIMFAFKKTQKISFFLKKVKNILFCLA